MANRTVPAVLEETGDGAAGVAGLAVVFPTKAEKLAEFCAATEFSAEISTEAGVGATDRVATVYSTVLKFRRHRPTTMLRTTTNALLVVL